MEDPNSNVRWKELYVMEVEKNQELTERLQSYNEDSIVNLEYIQTLEDDKRVLRKSNLNFYERYNEKIFQLKKSLISLTVSNALNFKENQLPFDSCPGKDEKYESNHLKELKYEELNTLTNMVTSLQEENSELHGRNIELSSGHIDLLTKLSGEQERIKELQEIILNLKIVK